MNTASQTPGALPPESPALPTRLSLRPGVTVGGPVVTVPVNPDVPEHLVVPGPEPVMPECVGCGDSAGPWFPCPQGRRYQSGAQVMYCAPCLPPERIVTAAEGVIAAAMEHGAATPREWAQAEHDAGLLFDAQAAADVASAAADQAHAEDAAEIKERGRQLAQMAGAVRQRDAVLRLLEGRPGTDLLAVAEIATAAEHGTTPFDGVPMTLKWTGVVGIPGPRDTSDRAVVACTSSYGGLAQLAVDGDDRRKLAALVANEVRDIDAPCPTDGCGTVDDYDPAFMLGWARLEVAGIEDDRPRWYCTPQCVSAALRRAGDELALQDQAAAVDPDEQAPGPLYGMDAATAEALEAEARLYPEAVLDRDALGGAW